LEAAPAAKRHELLAAYIRNQVNDILKFDSSHPLEVSQGFFQIGMDSLMAVELQHRVQGALGVSLSSTVSFDQPNIESLARYLLEKVLFSKLPGGANGVSTQKDVGAEALSADIQTLSEEELVRLLARELQPVDGENSGKSDRERQEVL
jgi:acyl carrier protein